MPECCEFAVAANNSRSSANCPCQLAFTGFLHLCEAVKQLLDVRDGRLAGQFAIQSNHPVIDPTCLGQNVIFGHAFMQIELAKNTFERVVRSELKSCVEQPGIGRCTPAETAIVRG